MICIIRPAVDGDAEAISSVIVSALRETNSKDYSAEIIERVAGNFTPDAVLGQIRVRTVFAAVRDGRIVGTASLEGRGVHAVMVSPEFQGQGIGTELMLEIERTARERGIPVLAVTSSITAEGFYKRLGFRAIRDHYWGDERTIFMERELTG